MPQMRTAPHRPRGWQGRQLKFVDFCLKRKRNRLKVGYNLLATLPEAICGNSDCEQFGELDEDETPSVESKGL